MSNLDTANNLLASAFGAGAFDSEYRPRLVKDGSDSWDVMQGEEYLGYVAMIDAGTTSNGKYESAEYYYVPINELRSPHHPDRFAEGYASLEEALADLTLGTRHAYMRGARNGQSINW
jgi:hypothetical protein